MVALSILNTPQPKKGLIETGSLSISMASLVQIHLVPLAGLKWIWGPVHWFLVFGILNPNYELVGGKLDWVVYHYDFCYFLGVFDGFYVGYYLKVDVEY